MNDDTLDKLYANQSQIDKNQRWLLQEKAGVQSIMTTVDIRKLFILKIEQEYSEKNLLTMMNNFLKWK